MRETHDVYTGYEKWHIVEFNSLNEFYDYLCNTPTNKAFEHKYYLSSQSTEATNWYKTKSYDEATNLFKNGWDAGAAELTAKFKVNKSENDVEKAYRNILDVCGYQAIVPLYLQGIPTSMVSKKLTPIKQKVITINKTISVSASVSAETMMNESIKCFQIIKRIEASGVRVNLNLMISTGHVCIKIRLKSSNEKLNISKLAFPLVHPSMFRRLYFRFIEVYPTIPNSYTSGYGRVPSEFEFKKVCDKKEIVLPTLLKGNYESEITKLSIDELIQKLK